MPSRISADVGDHPCFFTFFITMIPINCKITNFSLYLLFLRDYHHYFWCVPNKLLVENPLASTLHIQPIMQCYKQRTTWKVSLQSIQPLLKIRNARSSKRTTFKSGCVSLTQCTCMYHYASFCFQLFASLTNILNKE